MREPRRLGPWRAALNWHAAVLVFGALAATVLVTVPGLAVLLVAGGGRDPFQWQSGWLAVRVIQILQSLAIGLAGGALALRYFRRRFLTSYREMRRPLRILAAVAAAVPVATGAGIALLRYGPTAPMLATFALVFVPFIVCFLAGSLHFAARLAGPAGEPGPGAPQAGAAAGGPLPASGRAPESFRLAMLGLLEPVLEDLDRGSIGEAKAGLMAMAAILSGERPADRWGRPYAAYAQDLPAEPRAELLAAVSREFDGLLGRFERRDAHAAYDRLMAARRALWNRGQVLISD